MTATLAAMLVRTVTWNATPVTHFPELAGNADPSWNDATLLRLITNRAGAPKDLSPRGLWGKLWKSNETPPNLRRILLQDVIDHPTDYPPGTDYAYSNTNFAIAGMLTERAAQEPWESLIQRSLFKPLGITSAGFGAPGLTGVTSQPAATARWHPLSPRAPTTPGHRPAGTVHMSAATGPCLLPSPARDEANPKRACRLLSPKFFDTLHTPPDDHDYAGGWGVSQRDWAGGDGKWKGRVLTHAGSNTSWFCVTWLAPNRNFAVLVCTNIAGEHGPAAADAASWALIQKQIETQDSKK
jgi:CubicO group peptidase (beta-lactamase class C family)